MGTNTKSYPRSSTRPWRLTPDDLEGQKSRSSIWATTITCKRCELDPNIHRGTIMKPYHASPTHQSYFVYNARWQLGASCILTRSIYLRTKTHAMWISRICYILWMEQIMSEAWIFTRLYCLGYASKRRYCLSKVGGAWLVLKFSCRAGGFLPNYFLL